MPKTNKKSSKKRKSSGSVATAKSHDATDQHPSNTEIKENIKKLEAELALAKETNDKLLQNATTNMKAAANMNDAIVALVDDAVKGDLWRTIKFINDELQQKRFGKKIYKCLGKNVQHLDMDEFIATYSGHAVATLNQFRIYITNRLGEAVLSWLGSEDEGAGMPKTEDIVKCLERKIDPKKPEEMAFFRWYWDQFLPMATRGDSFKDCHRHFATISKAAP